MTDPAPIDDFKTATERRLPAKAVAGRYGVSIRTLDRWLERPQLGFPTPDVVNNRRYWWLDRLVRWERDRARVAAAGRSGEVA